MFYKTRSFIDVLKHPPLDSVLNWVCSIHIHKTNSCIILCFLFKILDAFLIISIRTTSSTHLILLLTLIIFGERYKLCSSSTRNIFLLLVISVSLSGPNIPLYTLFSSTSNLYTSFVD